MRWSWAIPLVLVPLGACGDSADEIAFARCKEEVLRTLRPAAGLKALRPPGGSELRDDAVYGWHIDVDVEAQGAGSRAGYRCLFLVEDRQTPLFLAVLER